MALYYTVVIGANQVPFSQAGFPLAPLVFNSPCESKSKTPVIIADVTREVSSQPEFWQKTSFRAHRVFSKFAFSNELFMLFAVTNCQKTLQLFKFS